MSKFTFFTKEQTRVVLMTSVGGILETYDFVVYAFAATILGRLFFPTYDELTSLTLAFAVMAISNLVRPFGGLFFSHFGDKRGRKKPFFTSIVLLAIPTILIGFLPTYATIGIVAPILLLLLRIMQGLAVGGEIPGALTLVAEHVNSQHRGFACACIFGSINLGLLLAQSVIVTLQALLTDDQFTQWGWRIAFYLGGLLGIMGIYIRAKLTETPAFTSLENSSKILAFPFKTLLTQHPKVLVQTAAIALLQPAQISLLFIFLPNYINTMHLTSFSSATINFMNGVNIFIFSSFIFIMGIVVDYIGRYKLLIFNCGIIMLTGYFFYSLALTGTLSGLIISMISLSFCAATTTACIPYLIITLFPTEVRYTGFALSYNVGQAIFGGAAPLLATVMITITHDNSSPAYYIIACAMVGFIIAIKLWRNVSLEFKNSKILQEF